MVSFHNDENHWQITSLVTKKSLFTVTHALFHIPCIIKHGRVTEEIYLWSIGSLQRDYIRGDSCCTGKYQEITLTGFVLKNWYSAIHREIGVRYVSETKMHMLWDGSIPDTFLTRRSENDSTLGRPRLENANISWESPFHTVIRFMVTSCHQISGRNVLCSISSSWLKPLMENFKVPRNAQKLAEHSHFSSDLLHGTVHHPTKFQADSWNFVRVITVTSSLWPGPSLLWKF